VPILFTSQAHLCTWVVRRSLENFVKELFPKPIQASSRIPSHMYSLVIGDRLWWCSFGNNQRLKIVCHSFGNFRGRSNALLVCGRATLLQFKLYLEILKSKWIRVRVCRWNCRYWRYRVEVLEGSLVKRKRNWKLVTFKDCSWLFFSLSGCYGGVHDVAQIGPK
jgi:hypothetical protein